MAKHKLKSDCVHELTGDQVYNYGVGYRFCAKCGKKVVTKSKFNSKKTEYNGKIYDSKREANYAAKLDLEIKAGIVDYYHEQMPLRYIGGGCLKIDFIVFNSDKSVRYVDAKGKKTAMYMAKKRIVEATYPIKIEEV
jgi:hypothetical protein